MATAGRDAGGEADVGETPPLKTAENAVQKLYEFRDTYFENFGIAKAADKTADVKKELASCVAKLEKLREKINNKAHFSMLWGKALNVLPHYDPKAEEYLSKAVKLDPKLVEAWNHLGECYWKHGDISSAKNCFIGALSHFKNKVSLRNLSMVMRQQSASDSVERAKIVEESVEKAREAVYMDISDGASWAILGNAYLSLFFAAGQNPQVLKQSMSAYLHADKDPLSQVSPDLHFNRAMACKYQEDYQLALSGFSQAALLDPSWSDPVDQETRLIQYLTNLTDLLNSQGKMKRKRLQNFRQSLKEADLGPYGGGKYTNALDKTIELHEKKLEELCIGLNANTVVVGKVICTISNEDPVPFTFCFIDKAGTCLPVTVYNIGRGYGVKIGDSVAVPEPFLQQVDISHKGKVYSYSSVRVDTPVVLVVNGRKLGLDKQAPSVLALSVLSE